MKTISKQEDIKWIFHCLDANNGNNILYLRVFNYLTSNNTVKNYTENNNGIFFNLDLFTEKEIEDLKDLIKAFVSIKNETDNFESLRKNMFEKYDKNEEKYENIRNLKQHMTKNKQLSTKLKEPTKIIPKSYSRIDKILRGKTVPKHDIDESESDEGVSQDEIPCETSDEDKSIVEDSSDEDLF